MASNDYQKYKERTPEETVAAIKAIMERVGIIPEEKWLRTVEGAMSVRLDFAGADCGTNGKGTDEAFARASGYAEAIERTQSGFLPKLMNINDASREYLGFFRAPDEASLTFEQIVATECTLLEELTDNYYAPDQESDIGLWPEGRPDAPKDIFATLKAWLAVSGDAQNESFNCVPYYSLKNKQVQMVPAWLAEYYQGSNGQCAGNTPVEALVQGMSELCERYAHLQIIRRRLVLPEIPRSYFAKHYPRIAALQESIEALGPFRVLVLDASLDLELPVVSVVFIHQGVHRYRITYGSHPSLAVATERCLTELLQGFSPVDEGNVAWGCLPLNKDDSFNFADYYNLENGQINGSGYMYVDYFKPQGVWNEACWQRWPLEGNEAMLKALTDKLLKLGRDVLIRDNSYLGFPSYTIIVPGLGGIGLNRRQLRTAAAVSWWLYRRLDPAPLTIAECQRLLLVLRHNSRTIDRKPLLTGISDLEVGAALLYKLDRVKAMSSFTKPLRASADGADKAYYACLDKWVWLTLNGRDPWPYLELFFGSDLTRRMRIDWVETCPLERLRKKVEAVDASVVEVCSRLRCRLKEEQQAHPIDQGAIARFFSA